MFKKTIFALFIFSHVGCAELQNAVNSFPQTGGLDNATIASGLREALDMGIEKQVSKLAETNGFLNNSAVKILLPPELQKVDKTLRGIGLGSLADEGLKVLNRAAENAVGEATPIFVDAVKGITFADARTILLRTDNSATTYLKTRTNDQLYDKFEPVIQQSFQKVGADKIWENLITRYNELPLTNNVNTNLTDYVTKEALKGVYTMIAVEEKNIRSSVAARSTDLLRRVFALQD